MATLNEKITEQQKLDLYNRKITTRELARILGVHENYLSRMYPGKIPIEKREDISKAKLALRATRKEFRLALLEQVALGKITLDEAAAQAHTTKRTLYRLMADEK
jgi:hypothetical protein